MDGFGRTLQAVPVVGILALVIFGGLWAPGGALATTYVPIADEDLARQAEVIVEARVAAAEPAPSGGPPSTDFFIQVERVYKGGVPGSTLIVRAPGGTGPDGVGLKIWGAPEFAEGERVILFLVPANDGTYGVLHFFLGAFREVRLGRRGLAVRRMSEVTELIPFGEGAAVAPRSEWVRSFDRFAGWLAVKGWLNGIEPDYWVRRHGALRLKVEGESHLMQDVCTGLHFRWREFDAAQPVRWKISRQARAGFVRALKAWNRDEGSDVRLKGVGGRRGARGLGHHDGVNEVTFDDLAGEIPGGFSCRAGGIVALSGIWFEHGRGPWCSADGGPGAEGPGGQGYLRILEADIVTNDGTACLLVGEPRLTAEVLAHEIGHTLGLSHVGSPGALMSGRIRGGEVEIELGSESRAALRRLYPRELEP